MHRGLFLFALLCGAAEAYAGFAQPVAQPLRVHSTTLRRPASAAVRMHLPVEAAADAMNAASTSLATSAASLPASLLLSEALDGLQGFATNPLILLLPIGGGTIVAGLIIFVLVKSAG